MTWYTTLKKIREHHPCVEGWKKLLAHLGKTTADDEKIAISTILESNGLDDAVWCLRAVDGKDKEIRLFAVWCARQVEHLLTDQRSKDVITAAEKFANGEATEEELQAARAAARDAWDAASAAAWAARAAAWDAWDAANEAQSARLLEMVE